MGVVSFSYAYAQIYEDIIKDMLLARDGVKEPMMGPTYPYTVIYRGSRSTSLKRIS